ncbi:MAG: TraB/GumN family protein, partial [Novosphingobium sp.]|nr:TraB/GumN family protein [Novosphingobium sp.]
MSALALVSALLGAPVAAQQQPASQPELAESARQEANPALWKVSDADTTIYLFGTIHLLPKGIDWYHGKVESAFEQADELVTEIPEGAEAEAPALVVRLGMLPSGESLRTQMDADERTKYEAALAGQGL